MSILDFTGNATDEFSGIVMVTAELLVKASIFPASARASVYDVEAEVS
jgi:hypothetical protein